MRQVTLAGALAAVILLLLLAGGGPAHAAFTPTYSMTIDENDMPNEFLAHPDDDDCMTNSVAFPNGVPCEMLSNTSILNANPSGTPPSQPIGRADTSIPKPKFTIADGFPITNGTPVGSLALNVGVFAGPNCVWPAVVVVQQQLVDAALPSYLAGPWASSSNGGDAEPGETSGSAALFNPNAWPINLESDTQADYWHDQGFPLIARYHTVLPVGAPPGLAVNILVFDAGTSYITATIAGDPAAPPSPFFCAPLTTTTDFLGSATDIGSSLSVKLRQCNLAGSDVVTATFTSTVGDVVNVQDTVSCSPAPTVNGSPGDFCITGDSTGIGWDWRIFAPSTGAVSYPGSVAPGLLPGSPPSALASAWAASIDGSYPGVSAIASGDCFHVELDPGVTGASSPSAFSLYVATGGPECLIVPLPGCSFNPIVYYVGPVGGAIALAVSGSDSPPLPAMPLAASMAALAASLAAAGWYARRRWLR